MTNYVAVKVKDHPARLAVYNLHRSDCRYANSGDPEVTTLEQYAEGRKITRATVPHETGWVFGKGSAGGNPNAPAWITTTKLKFVCGHCLRDLRLP